MRKQFKNKLLITFILLFYTDLRNMSSNAALSAARRRRSNPAPSGPSAPPPTNRILQRTGAGVPPPPFNPRMPPPQQHAQMRGVPLLSRPQGQGQVQFRQPPQQSQQPQQKMQQHMARPQSPGLPPLPPPVKTAGPLYGIPIHPLVMFKTHDNKLSEHELSIGDCLEHLKEIDERLAAVESSSSSSGSGGEGEAAGTGAAPAGDLNDLINDGAFINGVVDNIMNTTNFASIVDSIIPLKEENEALKQQVDALNGQVDALNGQVEEWEERMRQLEDRVRSIGSSCHIPSENVTQENNSSAQETCIGVTHEEEEKEEEEEHEA